mmetsp:Transcript_1414/g.1924  ORF Transcript_1414/g.1924 Transcript_1414/m.1924 type:complete len:250 (-) Transcript_1414:232-981(-)
MRILRAKNIRKQLRFYRINYGIHPPFKVLLDGNFIFSCLKVKMDILDRLIKLLQESRCQLFVPKAVIDELKSLGPKFDASYEFALSQEQPADDSPKENISASDSIEEIIGRTNENKYLVCTQDEELCGKLRKIAGTPIIHVQRALLILEQPSLVTRKGFSQAEKKKTTSLNDQEIEMLTVLKKNAAKKRKIERETLPKKRLKKKAKGPNPLSMKKKKSKDNQEPNKIPQSAKRKRRKKKKTADQQQPST